MSEVELFIAADRAARLFELFKGTLLVCGVIALAIVVAWLRDRLS